MAEGGLTGRVAVVTGAGTGLGTAIARALAEAGADLMLHYRSSAGSLANLAEDCRTMGRRVETEQADFAHPQGYRLDLRASRFDGPEITLVMRAEP